MPLILSVVTFPEVFLGFGNDREEQRDEEVYVSARPGDSYGLFVWGSSAAGSQDVDVAFDLLMLLEILPLIDDKC